MEHLAGWKKRYGKILPNMELRDIAEAKEGRQDSPDTNTPAERQAIFDEIGKRLTRPAGKAFALEEEKNAILARLRRQRTGEEERSWQADRMEKEPGRTAAIRMQAGLPPIPRNPEATSPASEARGAPIPSRPSSKPSYTPRRLGEPIKPITGAYGRLVAKPGVSYPHPGMGQGFGDPTGKIKALASQDVLGELKGEIGEFAKERASAPKEGGEEFLKAHIQELEKKLQELREADDDTDEVAETENELEAQRRKADELATIAGRMRNFLAKTTKSTNDLGEVDPVKKAMLLERATYKLGQGQDTDEEDEQLEGYEGLRNLNDEEKKKLALFTEEHPDLITSHLEDAAMQRKGMLPTRSGRQISLPENMVTDDLGAASSSGGTAEAPTSRAVIDPMKSEAMGLPTRGILERYLARAPVGDSARVKRIIEAAAARSGGGRHILPPGAPNTIGSSGSVEQVSRPMRAPKGRIESIATQLGIKDPKAKGQIARTEDTALGRQVGKPQLDPETWMPIRDKKGSIKGMQGGSRELGSYGIRRVHPVVKPVEKALRTEKKKGEGFFPERAEKEGKGPPTSRIAHNTTGLRLTPEEARWGPSKPSKAVEGKGKKISIKNLRAKAESHRMALQERAKRLGASDVTSLTRGLDEHGLAREWWQEDEDM